jgi:cysteine-rich repeat protein
VQTGEECDDGNKIDTDACRNTCVKAACGDGVLQKGVEECDDGNTVGGDYCGATCKRECILGGANVIANNSCYMGFATPMVWNSASAACISFGAHLVEIQSATENKSVQTLMTTLPASWTAATDRAVEGTFVWELSSTTSHALTFKSFAAGQPDNQPTGNADCVVISPTDGSWSDQPCSETHPFVCEHEF